MSERPPFLDVPLNGVQLIEASAGTGKTFTLATLVLRLVVERQLRIGQILTVTFTDAATQELRKRIRERLQLACAVMGAKAHEDDSAELSLCREVIDTYLETGTETKDALQRRLRQAVLETDLAAIFTIHGFCTRVLREHALEAGAGFEANELLTNTHALYAQLAADLWRTYAQHEESADDLLKLWNAPDALAKDLRLLCSPVPLLPPAAETACESAQRALQKAAKELKAQWSAHGEVFFSELKAAVESKRLNGNSYRLDWLEDLRGWLEAFAQQGETASTSTHEKLVKLTAVALEKGTNSKFKNNVPTSPITHEIENYLHAWSVLDAAQAQRQANLLHTLRDAARTRLTQLKQQQTVFTFDDLIDGVAVALSNTRGAEAEALMRSLREQYAIALVDEFQDTDARQWDIFERVFGRASGAPALFLIGDPKQAIYSFRGGDVQTYLAAAKKADKAPELRQNFRSRPAVLKAIAALYQHAENPFVDADINFIEVESGGKRGDASYLRNGEPAAAMTLWKAVTGEVDKHGAPTSYNAADSRMQATAACAEAIHAVLRDAREQRALIEGRPVRPGDIAVLVRTHSEALLIQQALAQRGIAAVAAGKQSLFATQEARELHQLLQAVLNVGDDMRLRGALASVLLGLDAQAIAALDAEGAALHAWQQQLMHWRERLQRGGPLALIGALCAQQGERLLGLQDGERRLSNYLQLAEALQEAQSTALGLHGLVDWLEQAISSADRDDEAQLLRLESDAHRVQIVTLHKSKGLEYPLVYLPFVGISGKAPTPKRNCEVHDHARGRRLHWKIEIPEAQWETAKDAWVLQQQAEDARLLYVGLTRARHALWLAYGDFSGYSRTALARLLGTQKGWAQNEAIVIDTAAVENGAAWLPPEAEAEPPPARHSAHQPRSDWWVYSFSQLASSDTGGVALSRSVATVPASGGRDETEGTQEVETATDPRFSGNRFGVALHAAFENTDFASWQAWHTGDAPSLAQREVITAALRSEGYASELIDDGVALCTQLIGHTLTAALPEGTRLCDLEPGEYRAEIEFQFTLQPTRVEALLQLLHAHGIVSERDRFGLRTQLEGLMTGLIDLTYFHAGKWYVLDYKSNRLPAYDAAAMQAAMAHSEYDLQALIYTLALHRWLCFRLGEGYDYARDFGGIRYLFCRGIDAGAGNSHGIHAQCFAPDLIHALDALFGTGEGAPL